MLSQTVSLFCPRPFEVSHLTRRKNKVLKPRPESLPHLLSCSLIYSHVGFPVFPQTCLARPHFTIRHWMFPSPGTCFLDICMLAPSLPLVFTQKLPFQQGLPWSPYFWLQPSSNTPTLPPLLYYPPQHIVPPDTVHILHTYFVYWLPLLALPNSSLLIGKALSSQLPFSDITPVAWNQPWSANVENWSFPPNSKSQNY